MSRYSPRPRCAVCGLRGPWCPCSEGPTVPLPWSLYILQHHREAHKPTNTARLLAHQVEGAVLHRYADPSAPWSADPELHAPAYLLFPAPDSRVADRAFVEEAGRERATLVVLDATWRQAARMARRAPWVCTLPRVAITPGSPSLWPIRNAPREDQRSSFEAVWQLTRLLPDARASDRLEALFRALVEGQVATRRTPPGHTEGA